MGIHFYKQAALTALHYTCGAVNWEPRCSDLFVEPADNVEVNEDPFSYFANVIRKNFTMKNYDPYSIENNMIVVKILDAARESAKTGTTIKFRP